MMRFQCAPPSMVLPDLTELGRRIPDVGVRKREIVDHGAGQRLLEVPVVHRSARARRSRDIRDRRPFRRERVRRALHRDARGDVPDRVDGTGRNGPAESRHEYCAPETSRTSAHDGHASARGGASRRRLRT